MCKQSFSGLFSEQALQFPTLTWFPSWSGLSCQGYWKKKSQKTPDQVSLQKVRRKWKPWGGEPFEMLGGSRARISSWLIRREPASSWNAHFSGDTVGLGPPKRCDSPKWRCIERNEEKWRGIWIAVRTQCRCNLRVRRTERGGEKGFEAEDGLQI